MESINVERNCDSLKQRLLTALFGPKNKIVGLGEEREIPRSFSIGPAISYLNAQCPSCKNIFGVSSEVIHKYSKEILVFRYTCPYCGFGGSM